MGVTTSSAQRALHTIQDWWLTIRHRRFFYGWWIVVVSLLSDLVGTGATAYTFGVFYKPMGVEFGWSRSLIAGAVTLRSITSGLVGPVIGPLVDRLGPRLIMVSGGMIGGLTIMAMGFMGNIVHLYILYGVIGALALTATGPLVTQTTVAKWFIRKRGRATAITAMGVSIAGMILVPITAYLIDAYGWRVAWSALGLLALVVMVPLSAIFMRRTPEDYGLQPDGESDPKATQAGSASAPARALETTWTLRAAIRTKALWLIILAFDLASMSISAILLHQVNYMSDKGFSTTTAAAVVSFYAFCAILAKLIWGIIAERVPVRYLNFVCFTGGAAGILILIQANTTFHLFLFAVVYGLTRGAYVLLIPLTYANYFGRAFLGAIRGFTYPFNIIASVGGQLFAAAVYDFTKSYDLAFYLFAGTSMLAGAILLLAKPPRAPSPASELAAP